MAAAALRATAAAVAGRPLREVGLVALTVLVGQAMLGWADDLTDRERDARRRTATSRSPRDRLDPGTVWFALTCAVLLVVPLAVANGDRAGVDLPRARSWSPRSATGSSTRARCRSSRGWSSFALYPAFLAYGGWGGVGSPRRPPGDGRPGGALGLGVHVLLALPGLVHDHEEGEQSLPLLVALRTGTPRLLLLAGVLDGARRRRDPDRRADRRTDLSRR